MSLARISIGIGVARAGFGVAAYLVPEPFATKSNMPGAAANPDARYMTRLFGGRDVVLGALTIAPQVRSTGLWAGVACDLLDVVSGLLAGRDEKDRQWVVRSTGTAAFFAIAGLVVARKVQIEGSGR